MVTMQTQGQTLRKQTVRILGIDPGLVNTGWGIIDCTGNTMSYVACGTIKPNSNMAMADRLTVIYKQLSNVINKYSVNESAIEDVFVNKNPDTSLRLGQARGVAMLSASVMGLSVGEYQNRMIKKSITGTGTADKNQMQAMINLLLPKAVLDSEHSCDALAVAITHANMRTFNALTHSNITANSNLTGDHRTIIKNGHMVGRGGSGNNTQLPKQKTAFKQLTKNGDIL